MMESKKQDYEHDDLEMDKQAGIVFRVIVVQEYLPDVADRIAPNSR